MPEGIPDTVAGIEDGPGSEKIGGHREQQAEVGEGHPGEENVGL